MRLIVTAAAAALLIAAAARAESAPNIVPHHSPTAPHRATVQADIGVICNTGAQAEDYVNLRKRGTDVMRAVNRINRQNRDPKACGVAAIDFKRGKTLATRTLGDKAVDIVEIDVVAGYDGHGWAPVPEMTQYAVLQAKGIEI